MLSRVAENLYWMSRYMERAENLVRLLIDAFQLELEIGSHPEKEVRPLEQVLKILNCPELFYRFRKNDLSTGEHNEEILYLLTFDKAYSISIADMIARARENAKSVQDTLSTEAWSQLNLLHLYLNSPKADQRFQSGAFRFFQKIKRECHLIVALLDTTLPRTEAFHFITVARYLERIDMLSRMINAHCQSYEPIRNGHLNNGAGPRLVQWASLLKSCSAHEAYLRHSNEYIDPPGVIRYLMLEEDFPRSMRFAVDICLQSLDTIRGDNSRSGTSIEKYLGRLKSELRYMDIEETLESGISPFLVSIQDICLMVGNEIESTYFRT